MTLIEGKPMTRRVRARNGIRSCGLALFLFVICPVVSDAADREMEKLVSANTAFGFSLIKQVGRERPNDNVFISPYSVSAALQMLWQGAGSETRKEMEQVLGFKELKADLAAKDYKDLDESLKA